jgi:methylated-DNA-[protein]-cysteine S-methyltransferase
MFTLDRKKIEKLVKDLPEFQRKVLLKVCEIPLGEVRSYKWVAEQIGQPKKVRQVGRALSKNPYPFFIPCHRVIRSDGSLGGYTFGVELKRYLLDLEKKVKSVIMMKKERKL